MARDNLLEKERNMGPIQLELNVLGEKDSAFFVMQKQLESMNESLGKVRRKLFSEMSELKKICHKLECENVDLKNQLKELKNEKTDWSYKEGDCLFSMREIKEAVG